MVFFQNEQSVRTLDDRAVSPLCRAFGAHAQARKYFILFSIQHNFRTISRKLASFAGMFVPPLQIGQGVKHSEDFGIAFLFIAQEGLGLANFPAVADFAHIQIEDLLLCRFIRFGRQGHFNPADIVRADRSQMVILKITCALNFQRGIVSFAGSDHIFVGLRTAHKELITLAVRCPPKFHFNGSASFGHHIPRRAELSQTGLFHRRNEPDNFQFMQLPQIIVDCVEISAHLLRLNDIPLRIAFFLRLVVLLSSVSGSRAFSFLKHDVFTPRLMQRQALNLLGTDDQRRFFAHIDVLLQEEMLEINRCFQNRLPAFNIYIVGLAVGRFGSDSQNAFIFRLIPRFHGQLQFVLGLIERKRRIIFRLGIFQNHR